MHVYLQREVILEYDLYLNVELLAMLGKGA